MNLNKHTQEEYGTLYDHTAVLRMADGSYKAVHIQDGWDNLDSEDYANGFSWYIDYEMKDFETKPEEDDLFYDEGYGGMLCCDDKFEEEHPSWESLIEAVADMEDIKPEDIVEADLYKWRAGEEPDKITPNKLANAVEKAAADAAEKQIKPEDQERSSKEER